MKHGRVAVFAVRTICTVYIRNFAVRVGLKRHIFVRVLCEIFEIFEKNSCTCFLLSTMLRKFV